MSVAVGLSVPWDLWNLDAAARQSRLASIADAGIDHLFTADRDVEYETIAAVRALLNVAA